MGNNHDLQSNSNVGEIMINKRQQGNRQARGATPPKPKIPTTTDFLYGNYLEAAVYASERTGKEVVSKKTYCDRLKACRECACFEKVSNELPPVCLNVASHGSDTSVLWKAESSCPRADDCKWGIVTPVTYEELVSDNMTDPASIFEILSGEQNETTD